MTVATVHKDPDARTMTMTLQLAATVERAWQLWADPRQLERWWGPPTHPATFVDHDLTAGGWVSYFMTGPDGEKYHGAWRVLAVDAPHRLEVEDVFTDESGTPNLELPATAMDVELSPADDSGTTMTLTSRFPSLEAMEQVLSMGAEEGMQQALSQIDAILRDEPGRR